MTLTGYLLLTHYLYLSLWIISVPHLHTLFLYLSRALSLSCSLSLARSFSLSLSLFLSPSLSFFLSFFLPLSLYVSWLSAKGIVCYAVYVHMYVSVCCSLLCLVLLCWRDTTFSNHQIVHGFPLLPFSSPWLPWASGSYIAQSSLEQTRWILFLLIWPQAVRGYSTQRYRT